MPSEPDAQRATTAIPSVIRVAAIWAGPIPTNTLVSADVLDHIKEVAEESLWELPAETSAWPVNAGTPEIETRRMDSMWHTLKKYHNKQKLRSLYRMSYKSLAKLNPTLDLDNLEEGQKVLVWKRNSSRIAESRGKANNGRLRFGEPLPPGEGYHRLYPHRQFGTYYAISEIVRVLDGYAEAHPDAAPLIVGDISFHGGRSIKPHRSHRSGRDVDITYPRNNAPPNYKRFHYIRRSDFNVEQSFWLLKDFIDGGQVEYLFVDRRWQRKLYNYAKKQGATDEWLNAVFQHRSTRGGRAIIRHARGHDKHFHVRFKCQETDRRCH